MIICKICGKELKNKLGIPSHLTHSHNISAKDYYDQYIKIDTDGKCKICGKPTSFINAIDGYRAYCSSKCANSDPDIQDKIKSHMTDEKRQAKIDKTRETNIKKYGVASVLQLSSTRQKCKDAISSEVTIKKRQETCLKKYGATNPFSSTEIQNKIKKNNIEKYGSENIFASEYGKNKIKQTCLERYGCENGGASKKAQVKIKETRELKSKEFCSQNACIPLTELDVSYSVKDSVFHSKLLMYNDRYYVKISDIDEILKHEPASTGKSVVENNIASFVEQHYNKTIIRNTRSVIHPKELDIYLPDIKVAIEVDGIWYHSANAGTDSHYHLDKSIACEELGIRLIHITDHDWINKTDICKSIILSALGNYETKIYARQCIIQEVDHNEADNFLNANHIQGKVKSTYRLGLYYNNELVQLICIGSSRFKKNEVELLRMCTKLNTQVIGGFSKLMKHQPYAELISYVDRSIFSGNGYKALGFIIISTSGPSYKYYKDNISLNRITAQKHKLSKLLGSAFNPNETESQNMRRCGWLQVYDCGTIKMQYKRK